MGKQSPPGDALVHGVSYDSTEAARPPIPVKTSSIPEATTPSPHVETGRTHTSKTLTSNLPDSLGFLNESTTPITLNPSSKEKSPHSKNGTNVEDNSSDWFRGIGSSPHESQTSLNTEERAASSLTSAPSVPQIHIESETNSNTTATTKPAAKKWLPLKPKSSDSKSPAKPEFQGLSLNIPSSGLSEEIGTKNMKFSNRGSMLIDGKKLNGQPATDAAPVKTTKTMPSITEPTIAPIQAATTVRKRAATAVADRLSTRIMSTDDQILSERVRSFYFVGSDSSWEQNTQSPTMANRMNLRWQDAATRDADRLTPSRGTSASDVSSSARSSTIPREDTELAGGLEDWQDVDNADVDRYGFIIPKSPTIQTNKASAGGIKRTPTTSGPGLQRVSTSLQLASDAPRRRHTIRRSPSNAQRINTDNSLGRTKSNQSMQRPTSSKSLNLPRQSATRNFANLFPHNRDRRIMDEAGDMLTLPRSSTTSTLTRTVTDESSTGTAGTYTPTTTPQSRRKETEREEKWRKMAHSVSNKPGTVGGGMTFTFDISNPKLVERTWKGIPDTWRASAWHAFLSASAAKYNKRHPQKPCLGDEQLVTMFHEYQQHNSPDDVQIDIDVPRTISSHIMFRRRYRGGQRLLFRVLHAMSMHFADTGYVQGMAALAATLLAYYEEEKAFIMLVRLWELRGLEELYKQGFGGLMEALDDFETHWLGQGDLRKKLDDLGIGPTAYGTKWYLTLFNYSIPFPAQLRVWDVFLLLGDDDDETFGLNRPATASNVAKNKRNHDETNPNAKDKPAATANNNEKADEKANFGSTLDILHATSAALIDGMRDILMESDFENAMKVLTSWVPIRDEDVFMRVAKAEWKVHRKTNSAKGN